jgi:hypothetical protein
MTLKATAPLDIEHTGQIAQSRPHHGEIRVERVRVNHRSDGVCGVVESVHKFKSERDEERDGQEHVRPNV